MPSTEHHIRVQRTARYYSYGKPGAKTTDVWFCCHGYGQLASSLIRKFEVLDEEANLVIAPEGLSRFYWNGFGGKPVASWMTSEDRLHEIEDYVAYLDQLYKTIMDGIPLDSRVTFFGFSQGTATVTRWISNRQSKADNLVLWAGPLASDVDWPSAGKVLKEVDLYFAYGKQDAFISEQQANEHRQAMQDMGIDHEVITFDGPHTVDRSALLELSQRIINKS